jgi:hypothetical protein
MTLQEKFDTLLGFIIVNTCYEEALFLKGSVCGWEDKFHKSEGTERVIYRRLVLEGRKRMKDLIYKMKRTAGLVGEGKGNITDEMISRAREYPLSNIIEINGRDYARCIDHDDKNPSMFCRNNYAHCFSCGYTGDPIDVMMKVNGLSFTEAVKEMQ